MSLTEAEHVFGGVHEDAINDFFTAFFGARPRHLSYGSPHFVPATSVSETRMAPIAFPGTGGIEWAVLFETPRIDLFDDDSGGAMPPELTLGPGQFTVRTTVTLVLLCGALPRDERDEEQQQQDGDRDGKRGGGGHVVRSSLEVWALCHPVVRPAAGPPQELSFRVNRVEIVDISPEPVEALLECLVEMLLGAVLSQMWIPLPALRAGAFELTLLRGPEVEDDQVKVYGNP